METKRSVDEQVSSIIKMVLEKCRYEKQIGYYKHPLTDYQARAAFYTASPKELIKEVDDKWLQLQNSRQINDIHGYLIFKSVSDIMLERQFPHYINTYSHYTNQCTSKSILPLSEQQFKDMLEAMGYALKQTKSKNWLLFENPKFTFDRYNYLSMVIKYRKNKQFYYVDERCVDSTLKFSKPWLRNTPPATSSETLQECSFYYMVSIVGYVSGLFSSQASDASFKKWLLEIALPKMNAESVLVMDKNCYKKLFEKSISRYHSKTDMIKWLKYNEIPHSDTMSKAELYKLIRNSTGTQSQSATYNYIRACGHDVLCLPSTFFELSLADKMWIFLNNFNNPTEMTIGGIKNWILSNIPLINISDWHTQQMNISKLEQDIYDTDQAVEDYVDQFLGLETQECEDKVCDCNEFYYTVSTTE